MYIAIKQHLSSTIKTYNLDNGPWWKVNYAPAEPDIDKTEVVSASDGGEVTSAFFRNVTEAYQSVVKGVTPEAVQLLITEMILMLKQVSIYKTYLFYSPVRTDDEWHSQILSAKVETSSGYIRNADGTWARIVNIAWTRRYFWQGDLKQVPLSNPTTINYDLLHRTDPVNTPTLNPVDVYNPRYMIVGTMTVDYMHGTITTTTPDLFNHINLDSIIYIWSSNGNSGIYTVASNTGEQLTLYAEPHSLSADETDTLYIQEVIANYIDVGVGTIEGDIPTPAYITLRNDTAHTNPLTAGTTNRIWDIWIYHNIDNPLTFDTIFEGESLSPANYMESAFSSAYRYHLITSYVGGGGSSYNWDLTQAYVQLCGGRYYKCGLRLASSPIYDNNVMIRISIIMAVTPIYVSDWIPVPKYLNYFELDAFQIPPIPGPIPGLGALELRIEFKSLTYEDMISLDYITIMPLTSWRKITPVGYGIENDEVIHDDGTEGVIYAYWPSYGNYAYHIGYGNGINLVPSAAQRLYFQTVGYNYETMGITLWYRPRRIIL